MLKEPALSQNVNNSEDCNLLNYISCYDIVQN